MTLLQELKKRKLFAAATHEREVEELLENEKVAIYVGFDATADSLHFGHLLQLINLKRVQDRGHTPILLVGGATTKIGDPSGKQDMRKMLTDEDIAHNIECFKKQFAKFIDLDKAIIVNNADWIDELTISEFIRLGFNFNVSDMLRMDCYATRRETGGLTLGEMCYLPMQSYDFMHLYKTHNCKIQMAGQDQWSNILGGVNLIRKTLGEKGNVFGLVTNLLLTSEGKKMGKTEKGAVWLDKNKFSTYDFYQYFRNVPDEDVLNLLKMLTFIPLEKLKEYESYKNEQLNELKEILAFEMTKLVHSEEEAEEAREKAKSVFSGGDDAPIKKIDMNEDTNILDFLVLSGLTPSKSEARRLVQQGGISIDNEKIGSLDYMVEKQRGEVLARKGKKVFVKIVF